MSNAYRSNGHANWRSYRDQVLRQPNSRVFLTNAFPLWRPRQHDWPDTYEELFGYAAGGEVAYKQATRDRRYPQIRLRWTLCRPQATICFGTSLWPEFRCLFELDEHPAEDGMCVYPEQHILLIGFLGQRGPAAGPMNNDEAGRIIHHLQNWNVVLP